MTALPFDPELVSFIRRVLSVAETGETEWNPSALYIYADDNRFRPPHKQITLSIGFTEGGGNLKKVLQRYIAEGGKLATQLEPYMQGLGGRDTLANNTAFVDLLKAAGKESVMADAQKECFDELYLEPAFVWAKEYGFTMPLSYLVIADSFLHSGSMLGFLMNSFSEKKPVAGGDEKKWITDYLDARKKWLSNHPNRILRNTVYRANCFIAELARDNWLLVDTPVVMTGTSIHLRA